MPGLILIAIALIFAFALGIFKKVKNQKIITGTAVSLKYSGSSKGRDRFRATVEYEINGRLYVVKTRKCSSRYCIGDKFKIAYNAENPKDAFVKPTIDTYIILTLLFIAGVVMTIKTI